jgi:hypothetical protein
MAILVRTDYFRIVVENFTGRIFIGPVLANTNMQFEHG